MSGVRYAPSPTGRLHLGNLRTAWIARHLATLAGLPFVVRVEDIDAPRVVPGAKEQQLADMAAVGAVADRVETQSAFGRRHREVFEAAAAAGVIYPCVCSRRQVKAALVGIASAPHEPVPVYDGRCRGGAEVGPTTQVGWRWRAEDPKADILVARTIGPRDQFVPAYHWACAIDDWDGRYEWLVRAWDLADARGPQRAIQRWLAAAEKSRDPLPRVFHTTTVVDRAGVRLEKRSRGVTLPELEASGWSGSRVAEAFRRSFAASLPAEGDGGEPRETVAVSDILR